MKKNKQMRLKATLLAIVAVLSLGFTSCTEEFGSDQTQGEPGFITLNLKTLKPKQSKTATDLSSDYQKIKNLNIFIFRGEDLILAKYMTETDAGVSFADITNIINIRVGVGTLLSTDSVAVVANYGSLISVASKAALQDLTIPTVGDFSATGLCMTGINAVTVTSPSVYKTEVKIAPAISKISVKFETSGDAANYDITGIYVVNAVSSTKLPLVLAGGTNRVITSLLTPATKTVYSGINVTDAMAIAGNYNIYTHTVPATAILLDTLYTGLSDSTLYSYYVGENYHAALPTGAGSLFDQSTTNNTNANTLILIKAQPKSSAPQWMQDAGTKYYTYDLSAGIATTSGVASPNAISGAATDGFSTKRKTNYVLSFGLSSVGTALPFARMGNLEVKVVAEPWDYGTVTPTF